MAGGAIGDGVIVDLSRFREIGPVNAEARSIVVEPGAVRGDVNKAAESHGLRFPVDPSSGSFCTIGGMVSTNAAGAHSLFFGSTRRWVRSLRCIFEDGSIADVRRGAPAPDHIQAVARFLRDAHPIIAAAEEVSRARHTGVRKESSGYATADYARSYDLVDLLAGSEGTLVIFVGIELSLTPMAISTTRSTPPFALVRKERRHASSSTGRSSMSQELVASPTCLMTWRRCCSRRSSAIRRQRRAPRHRLSPLSSSARERRRCVSRSTKRRRPSYGNCATRRAPFCLVWIHHSARCNSSRTAPFLQTDSPIMSAAFARVWPATEFVG